MAGWNTDIPWEDELPDDLPPEERWEFSIAQLADEDTDEVSLPGEVRREPIAQQMLDRYRKLDAVLRNEAAKPIEGFDWDQTADQIDQYVRGQSEAEERSMLLGGVETRSQSFWANTWVKPVLGLAAAAAVVLAIYGVWPTGPADNPGGVAPIAGNEPDPATPNVNTQEPVLLVEVPDTPTPGNDVVTGASKLEVELVQPPDLADVMWDLPVITSQERATGSEVFIGPAEAPVEDRPVDQ
ncbi:MAG: hypothetical protein AAGD32_14290 [Planctomycetota bacterium]